MILLILLLLNSFISGCCHLKFASCSLLFTPLPKTCSELICTPNLSKLLLATCSREINYRYIWSLIYKLSRNGKLWACKCPRIVQNNSQCLNYFGKLFDAAASVNKNIESMKKCIQAFKFFGIISTAKVRCIHNNWEFRTHL